MYKYYSSFGDKFHQFELNGEIYDKVNFELADKTKLCRLEECKDGFIRIYWDDYNDSAIKAEFKLQNFISGDFGENLYIKLPLSNGKFIKIKVTEVKWARC
jgi:hypothetical protein